MKNNSSEFLMLGKDFIFMAREEDILNYQVPEQCKTSLLKRLCKNVPHQLDDISTICAFRGEILELLYIEASMTWSVIAITATIKYVPLCHIFIDQ